MTNLRVSNRLVTSTVTGLARLLVIGRYASRWTSSNSIICARHIRTEQPLTADTAVIRNGLNLYLRPSLLQLLANPLEMTIKNKPTTEIPTTKIRLIAAALVPTMLLTGVFSIYWLWTNVLPIYGRIYRNAPVIEVPYLAFGLLMAPPAIIITVIGSAIAVWTGKNLTLRDRRNFIASKILCSAPP